MTYLLVRIGKKSFQFITSNHAPKFKKWGGLATFHWSLLCLGTILWSLYSNPNWAQHLCTLLFIIQLKLTKFVIELSKHSQK